MRSTQMQPQRLKMPTMYRWLAALLLTALLWGQAGGLASADDTVTGVELSSIPNNLIYVNEDSISLTLWGTVNGAKKDVTSNATWTSSNSAVSVTGGVVTAKSNASAAVITGKYGGYTATVTVKAVYRYSSLEIRQMSNDTAIPAKLDASLGDTLNWTAYGIGTDAGDSKGVTDDATWTSSNSAVASVDDGVVTLNAAGTVTITASYLGRSDSVVLTVASPYKSLAIQKGGANQTIPIEGFVDDDEVALAAVATLKSNGSTEDVTSSVTWTSSNTSVAKVDEDGSVTLVGLGTATITASYRGVSGTVTFVVRAPNEALRLDPEKTLRLPLQGGAYQVHAYTMDSAVQKDEVSGAATWTSSNLVVATVDNNGSVYVLPKSAGTTTITASYRGLTRSFTLTVYPTMLSMKIDKDSVDTYIDEKGAFPSVSGESLAGDTVDLGSAVTWTSSDTSVAKVEDGKWTAVGIGTATLTATLDGGGGATLTASFTLKVNKKIHMLVVDTDSVSIITGKEVEYPTVHVIYENGDEEDVKEQVAWKSSSANVLVKSATNTWKGLVGAKATMTGTYLNATIKVQAVVEDEYVTYTIDPTRIDLTIKKSKSIKVTGKTKTGKKVSLGSRIEWTSSDESVLTVSGTSAKSLTEGSGTLTATFQGKSLSLPFSVKAKLTKLSASTTSVSLTPGGLEAVKIFAVYENGKTLEVTDAATWTATTVKVATVSKGAISAVAKGSTTVKATYDGKTVSIRVKVSK